MSDDLLEIKGKNRKQLPVTRNYKESDFYQPDPEDSEAANKRIPPWYIFAIPVGAFIANKAIQSVLNFTTGTNNIIDIVVVIALITAFWIYVRYYFGGKNG